ncbi:hypothetical protein BZG36_03927 [Bifiguratus adelaidae]|uniref:Mid2 domain-containing protein n=1 Tax=Bifiguratus adelaidae TaxID=1938954 RepID=A0A261XZ45_9FUNG|nr:hypothetical protein BZG36_03927 [Bifiguratus adelaidae]
MNVQAWILVSLLAIAYGQIISGGIGVSLPVSASLPPVNTVTTTTGTGTTTTPTSTTAAMSMASSLSGPSGSTLTTSGSTSGAASSSTSATTTSTGSNILTLTTPPSSFIFSYPPSLVPVTITSDGKEMTLASTVPGYVATYAGAAAASAYNMLKSQAGPTPPPHYAIFAFVGAFSGVFLIGLLYGFFIRKRQKMWDYVPPAKAGFVPSMPSMPSMNVSSPFPRHREPDREGLLSDPSTPYRDNKGEMDPYVRPSHGRYPSSGTGGTPFSYSSSPHRGDYFEDYKV